jgi:rubrerythrin
MSKVFDANVKISHLNSRVNGPSRSNNRRNLSERLAADVLRERTNVWIDPHGKEDEMSRIQSIVCVASKLSIALALTATLTPGAKASATTLENMQAAYNGESNAHARYLAFAKKAEAEGYGEVASLFRAAARAEKIHATNHAAVIEEMGAMPKAVIDQAAVKSTRENLEAALKGETYERDTMYPDFLKEARADRNSRAVRSLNLAKSAEAEHAKLYEAALAKLNQLKGTKAMTYLVCPICGYTVSQADFPKCPSCFTPTEEFEKVV